MSAANRLIIIGNGFDVANDLPTKYEHFVDDYIRKCLSDFYEEKQNKNSDDEMISFELINEQHNRSTVGPVVLKNKGISLETLVKKLLQIKNINKKNISLESGLRLRIIANNSLFWEILTSRTILWCNIESIYYNKLVSIIKRLESSESFEAKKPAWIDLETLNKELETIKKHLESYLSNLKISEDLTKEQMEFIQLFQRPFSEHFYNEYKKNENQKLLKHDEPPIIASGFVSNAFPQNLIFLNFNFTDTLNSFKRKLNKEPVIINIHGQLNDSDNPIVFGYGDEVTESYKSMENLNDNRFFEHVKSFMYFRSENYYKLMRAIESKFFDVQIYGHSCGLTDRTLLKSIFESPKCLSINIFYHENPESYRTTTFEISRHFTDKPSMRDKVVSYQNDSTEMCPQKKNPKS